MLSFFVIFYEFVTIMSCHSTDSADKDVKIHSCCVYNFKFCKYVRDVVLLKFACSRDMLGLFIVSRNNV